MTLITITLLGAGVLFVASALDNTPLVATFQKIVQGTAIDWTGASTNTGNKQAKISPTGNTTSAINTPPKGI